MRLGILMITAMTIGATGCATTPKEDRPRNQSPPIAADATQVQPLGEGDIIPGVTLKRPDGATVDTATVFAINPTVLVIYRGGWCPYCTRQMQDLAKIEPQVRQLGYQIVAVSPDRPEELAKSIADQKLTYTLLSDSDIALARSVGLAFRVDDATFRRLQGMGVDLEQASGRDHHVLPVPAVYLLDRTGTIHFAYWDPDYKTRLSGDELIAAARRLADATE